MPVVGCSACVEAVNVTRKGRVELRQQGGGYSFHLASSDVLLALAPVVAAARKLILLIASLRLPEHKDKLGRT